MEKLSEVIAEDCIISSNTSTIPISELASMTTKEERFIGLHFSNPPVMMPLIEIIRGDKTGDATVRRTEDLVRALGRDYVIVKKDVPGFVINRLNDRVITESMTFLEEGVKKEDLDAMVRFRLNFPMGVCELLDFVGIDTAYLANKELISRGFNTRSSSILKEKVESGKIGMKSGEGFYKYSTDLKSLRVVVVLILEKISFVASLRTFFFERLSRLHLIFCLAFERTSSLISDRRTSNPAMAQSSAIP